MAKNDELLKTLREYLRQETVPQVITEDVDSQAIAAIDVVPQEIESGQRRYLISVIGFVDRASPRGTGPQRHVGEGPNTSGGDFDAGTEFIARDPNFWEMDPKELEKYKVGFIPKSKDDIPDWLPDYLGYVYEPGGLNAVWDDWGEEPSDEMDKQARLDAAADIEAAEDGTVTVYDRNKNEWIKVPEEEIPENRPVGSFGYYKLERYTTDSGNVKYKPFQRRIPGFPTSRGADQPYEAIKTPWQLFVDWWTVASKPLHDQGLMIKVGGTDVSPSSEGEKRAYYQRVMGEIGTLRAQLESEYNGQNRPGKIKELSDRLEVAMQRKNLIEKYGALAFRHDPDYDAPPVVNGKHPPLYSTAFNRVVNHINKEAARHGYTEEQLNDFIEAFKNADMDEMPPWMRDIFFHLDDPGARETNVGFMRKYLKGLKRTKHRQRFAAHDPEYTPKGERKKKEEKPEEIDPKDLELGPDASVYDIMARAKKRRELAKRRESESGRRDFSAAERLKNTGKYRERMRQQIMMMRDLVDADGNRLYSDEEIEQHIRTGVKDLDNPNESLLYVASEIIAEASFADFVNDLASDPKQPKSNKGVDYKTHCSHCIFPADVSIEGLGGPYGIDSKEGATGRQRDPDAITDDIDAIQYQFMPRKIGNTMVDLADTPVSGFLPDEQRRILRWDISLEAAEKLVKMLSRSKPKWLELSIEKTRWRDTDHFKQYADLIKNTQDEINQELEKNPGMTPQEQEQLASSRFMEMGGIAAPEELADEPVSPLFGRIWVKTKMRMPGKALGYGNIKHPSDARSKKEFRDIERKLLSGHKTGGGDPSSLGQVATWPVTQRGGKYYFGDGDEEMFDGRDLASSDPAVRDEKFDDLKKFVRDWFTSGSMGKARAGSISAGQSKSRAGKTAKDQAKQVANFLQLVDELKTQCSLFTTVYGRPVITFNEAEVMEALSRALARMGAHLRPEDMTEAGLTDEKWREVNTRIRSKVLEWLKQAKDTPRVELGELLMAVKLQLESIDRGNSGRAAIASDLIEEALDRLGGTPHEIDIDIDNLLQIKDRCEYTRHILKQDPRLFATTLALQGYTTEAVETGTMSLAESQEIAALKSGVVSEDLQPLVVKASAILASESYGSALKVFARVVPQLGLEDLRHLGKITPQRITNNGVLADNSIEAVLEDIGISYSTLLSNPKNGSITSVWTKIGNL